MVVAQPASAGDRGSNGRVTVDLDDTGPRAGLRPAITVAAQGDLTLELVARSARPSLALARELQARCDGAVAAGAPRASWATVDPADGSIDEYARWSGSDLIVRCRPAARPPAPSWIPVLVGGRRTRPDIVRHDRMVVCIDAFRSGMQVALQAEAAAEMIGASMALLEIIEPSAATAEVPETANLRHVTRRLTCRLDDFDTVRDADPAHGILRYVGRDTGTIIVLGMTQGGRRASRHRVANRLLRASMCPLLLVPVHARLLGGNDGDGDWPVMAQRQVPAGHTAIHR